MKYKTGKRELIIKFLRINSARAFTLEEISDEIASDGKGKSTVYRIVSELVSNGSVRRLSDGKTRHCTYQYIGDAECASHLHLKCRDCGKLIHLCDEISNEFASALLSLDGFTLEAGSMLFGKCANCKSEDTSAVTPLGVTCHDYKHGKENDKT